MSLPSTSELHQMFYGIQTLYMSRAMAFKLTSHLITRGSSFFVEQRESEWVITMPSHIDLEVLRRKLPTLKFTI